MIAPPSITDALDWTRTTYQVRVRETMYLWGSAGVLQDLSFATPLTLHVYNSVVGEPITIGTRVASGTPNVLGTLRPGECLSIPIQGMSGVFATCSLESLVLCHIKGD
ncbi:MAG TPA: hypothetical protein VGF94_14910 [Kofleriaceae bacterium]|jgi:hypothetical protein